MAGLQRLRRQAAARAVGRHAAARLALPRPAARSAAAADGRAVRRARCHDARRHGARAAAHLGRARPRPRGAQDRRCSSPIRSPRRSSCPIAWWSCRRAPAASRQTCRIDLPRPRTVELRASEAFGRLSLEIFRALTGRRQPVGRLAPALPDKTRRTTPGEDHGHRRHPDEERRQGHQRRCQAVRLGGSVLPRRPAHRGGDRDPRRRARLLPGQADAARARGQPAREVRPRDHERDGRARPAGLDPAREVRLRRRQLHDLRPGRARGRARSIRATARR